MLASDWTVLYAASTLFEINFYSFLHCLNLKAVSRFQS